MLSMGSASEPHTGERQMAMCVCVVIVLSPAPSGLPAPSSGYALGPLLSILSIATLTLFFDCV